MPDASYVQTNFLGGEWSPLMLGRFDLPTYRTALRLCLNTLPIEEGSATRRPGLKAIATTRMGLPAVLKEFHFSENSPYVMELTQQHVRLLSGTSLVVNSPETQRINKVSQANPGVVTTKTAHGWTTGDNVQFNIFPGSDLLEINVTIAPLLGRELQIRTTLAFWVGN